MEKKTRVTKSGSVRFLVNRLRLRAEEQQGRNGIRGTEEAVFENDLVAKN